MSAKQSAEFTYELDTVESVVDGVIEATSEAVNADPTSMDLLFSTIDPDALNDLFDPRHSGQPQVEFRYNGCDVHIKSDREIVIRTPVN